LNTWWLVRTRVGHGRDAEPAASRCWQPWQFVGAVSLLINCLTDEMADTPRRGGPGWSLPEVVDAISSRSTFAHSRPSAQKWTGAPALGVRNATSTEFALIRTIAYLVYKLGPFMLLQSYKWLAGAVKCQLEKQLFFCVEVKPLKV